VASDKSSDTAKSLDVRLKSLYSQQHNLLDRLQIHQRNLEKLSLQEAKYGISVPLSLMNEIELQQVRIAEIEKQLALVDGQVYELTRAHAHVGSPHDRPITSIHIEGIDYIVDCLFPTLGSKSTMLQDGTIRTEQQYVGGFELHTLMRWEQGLELTFFRHGRRVAPLLDTEQKKLSFPLGTPVAVPAIASNLLKRESFLDITADRITEGRWTIISPNTPQPATMYTDWPQGYNDFIMTTRIPYDGGYELWMVQTMHSHPMNYPIMLWFYAKDSNVAPMVDKDRLALMFPIESTNP
jgi:hypothetical protein